MQPLVLKSLAGPKLTLGLPGDLLYTWVFGVGIGGGSMVSFLLIDIPIGLLAFVPIYYHFWKKTQRNPYFVEEGKAFRAFPSTENPHPTKGNYYSA